MRVPMTALSSVKSIKEAVARRHGVATDNLRLIFAGQELNEGKPLAVSDSLGAAQRVVKTLTELCTQVVVVMSSLIKLCQNSMPHLSKIRL